MGAVNIPENSGRMSSGAISDTQNTILPQPASQLLLVFLARRKKKERKKERKKKEVNLIKPGTRYKPKEQETSRANGRKKETTAGARGDQHAEHNGRDVI